MYKYFKYPINHPSKYASLQKEADAGRWIWNYFLTRNINQYQIDKTFVWYNQMSKELTQLKQVHLGSQLRYPWLVEVSSTPLQQKLKDLDLALHQAKRGFPRFKSKKYKSDSFRHNQAFGIKTNQIKIPKIGKIRIKQHRPLEGKVKNITIKQDNDKWHCSILCQLPDISTKELTTSVGIDLGLKTFAVLSNGQSYHMPKYYRSKQEQLAKRQRALARKQISSKRRDKAKSSVRRLHRHISNQRLNELHHWSKAITKQYDIICVEDLNIKDMLSNHNMAKVISDQGWAMFINQLEYKSLWAGGKTIKIDRYYPSSKTCSSCGSIKKLTLNDREYVCASCGCVIDRDLNASINIEQRGLSTGSYKSVSPDIMMGAGPTSTVL